MFRISLLLIAAALSGGCVTYHYPVPAPGEAVQGEAEYSGYYNDYAPVTTTVTYASAPYYPYWSMDYFYLGYGYGNTTISVGFGGAWSPWYSGYRWPYYGGWAYPYPAYYPVYYPVYRPWPRHYWAGNDYYWRHKWDRHDRHPPPRHSGPGNPGRPGGPPGHNAPGQADYAPYRDQDPGRRGPGAFTSADRGRQVLETSGDGDWRPGTSRSVEGVATNVRSAGNAKPGRSRTHPVSVARPVESSPVQISRSPTRVISTSRKPVSVAPSNPVRNPGVVTRRTSGSPVSVAGDVRSRSATKPTSSRTQPVSRAPVIRSQPVGRAPVSRSSSGVKFKSPAGNARSSGPSNSRQVSSRPSKSSGSSRSPSRGSVSLDRD
ncbi:hypothetical protein F3N42_07980 [Marinihelvus fidelis]|uniref:DUF3300 domain-containing protein n=1 Tax=Marinihelvus fidelis TaxID=2613842 RepID=A0A5N0T949_9GAMM|nr:hypothetical protein [Marinihelvus fidelis]KAA9131258.1 hypothetical protein F3N42_07980 [Marinihelvus fidelis]